MIGPRPGRCGLPPSFSFRESQLPLLRFSRKLTRLSSVVSGGGLIPSSLEPGDVELRHIPGVLRIISAAGRPFPHHSLKA